jgi:glycosyltransferase involved in cell wall biosynthesis
VGAFPSYIEGFGFAVLEQLASGIPTVAYDVPGPREMLRHFEANGDVMVKAGDIETFSQKIVDFLGFDALSYARVSQRCLRVAQRFSWSQIARETLDVYCQFLRTKLEE